jgi:hypothetical protein
VIIVKAKEARISRRRFGENKQRIKETKKGKEEKERGSYRVCQVTQRQVPQASNPSPKNEGKSPQKDR